MMCENPTTVQGLYMNFSFTFEVPHAEFERISRLQKWSTLSMSSWDIMALACVAPFNSLARQEDDRPAYLKGRPTKH